MGDYIGKVTNDTPEDMKVVSETLASHQPFDIAEDVTKLSQTNADPFHHFVEYPLYLSKRALPYMHLEV